MRKSYIKASRVPSPHLVRTCNSGKVSKDMTNTEDTDSAFFSWHAIDVSRQQRKKSVWTENAAVTLISNFLSTEVKRSPQTIYTSLQSQLGKSQNAGAYLGNTNIQKENLIYSSCISRWVLSITRAVTTRPFVTQESAFLFHICIILVLIFQSLLMMQVRQVPQASGDQLRGCPTPFPL